MKRKSNVILNMGDYHLMLVKYKDITLPVRIDNDDIDKVAARYWRAHRKPNKEVYYIVTGNRNNFVQLHRFIMNTPKDMVVDHINHDTLDNRKANLRNCTVAVNNLNRRKYSNVSSETGMQGVSVQYRVRVAGYK